MSHTTTNYGTFATQCPDAAGTATLKDYVTSSLSDFADQYDVDGLTDAFRQALNTQLEPSGVSMHGDEFFGPYPKVDVDIPTAWRDVDFWEIAERYELLNINQVAELLSYTGKSAAGSARKTLSRLGVKAADYRPRPDSGRPQALYSAHEVQDALKSRPGQGARTDREDV